MINYTPSFFTSSLSHSYTSPRNTRKDWTRQMELPIAAAVAVPEVGATASLLAATEAMDQTIASATTINGTNASSSCSSTSKKVFTIQPPRGPPGTIIILLPLFCFYRYCLFPSSFSASFLRGNLPALDPPSLPLSVLSLISCSRDERSDRRNSVWRPSLFQAVSNMNQPFLPHFVPLSLATLPPLPPSLL